MGYSITTIKNLPEGLSFYFFLVGDYRNQNVINDLFRGDFDIIADRLGEYSGIVKQTTHSRVENELIDALSGWVFSNTEASLYFEQIFMRYPGLLVVNQHPSKLTDASEILYFPFSVLEETYRSTNDLIADLVNFARYRSVDILLKTTRKHKLIKGTNLSLTLGVISLNFDF
jgi:hypothetical protein